MKRTAFTFTIAATLILSGTLTAAAAERPYKPHSRVNDPALVMQLRQEMSHLENGFVEIETHVTAGQLDYDQILKSIEQMEATRRTIQRVAPNREWNPLLKDLSAQLQKIRNSAAKQDPITLRKNIDAMYDSCFRCHATNTPKHDKN